MKYLKLFEKLDIVLTHFNNKKDRDMSPTELSAYLLLTYPGIFTDNELKSIINTLLKSRHIAITTPGFYKITLEGTVFSENGGYVIQRKASYVKRQYLKVARNSGNQSSNLVLWILGIMGMVVAFLVLRYCYDHFNWKIPF